jgi:hypothetical protein
MANSGIKIILIDRYSFWQVLASTGRRSYEVGTMMKHEGETPKQATPRGLALWEKYKEEITKKKGDVV